MNEINSPTTLAQRIYNIRIPTLFEIFFGRVARWVRQLREWRKLGLLKKAMEHKRRLRAAPRMEALEPRVLLSADLAYVNTGADATHFNDGDLANNDYFLDIYDDGLAGKLRLFAEDGTVLVEGSLAADGVNKIDITGFDGVGDQLHVNLSSTVGTSYAVEILFDGGSADLVGDDTVQIVGNGVYQFQSFKLTSTDDVTIAGSITASGDITIESKAMSDGGLLGTDIFANADAGIVMASGTLNGANISLTAESTVNVDGDNVSMLGSIAIGAVYSDSHAAVTVNGGTINATGNLTLSAASDVTTLVSRKPDSSANDTAADAVIALSYIDSSAAVKVSGGVLSAGGHLDATASNTVSITTTADGSAGANAGTAAGATLAFTLLTGDTLAQVTGGTLQADDVNVAATAQQDIHTKAISTQGGATQSVGGTNQSESKLADPRGDGTGAGKDADKAATSDGDVDFAAAVAVTVNTGTVHVSIADANVTASDGDGGTADTITLLASSTKTIETRSDGSATAKDATGTGLGVAISVVDTDTLATLGGTTSLTATDVKASALVQPSTFTVEAKSGASSNTDAIAGSLAMNFAFLDTGAKVLAGSSIDLHGANLMLEAKADAHSDVKALAASTSDSKSDDAGVGISVAVNVVNADTVAVIEANAGVSNAKDVGLAATASHVADTKATAGGNSPAGDAGGGALALAVIDNATEAKLLAGGSALDIGGALSLTADHHGVSTTIADATALGADTAVGAAIALGFVRDSAVATVGRSVTADGAVTLTARGDGSSKSEAKGSAVGADKGKEGTKGNTSADDQTAKATQLAKDKSGDSSLSVGKSASTDDGQSGGSVWSGGSRCGAGAECGVEPCDGGDW